MLYYSLSIITQPQDELLIASAEAIVRVHPGGSEQRFSECSDRYFTGVRVGSSSLIQSEESRGLFSGQTHPAGRFSHTDSSSPLDYTDFRLSSGF